MKHWITLLCNLCLLALLAGCIGTSGKTTITPPADIPKEETLTLFLPKDDADGLELETVKGTPTPQGLIDALIEEGAIPAGTTVLDFTQTDDGATLNLSQAYINALHQTGTAGELMLIYTVVDTFLTHYKLNTLTLLGEGTVIETGHSVYDAPLSFYLPELDDTAYAYQFGASKNQTGVLGQIAVDEVEILSMGEEERIAEIQKEHPGFTPEFLDGYEILNFSQKQETYKLAEDADLRLWDEIYKIATPEELDAKLREHQKDGILCCFEEENGVITTLYEYLTPQGRTQ